MKHVRERREGGGDRTRAGKEERGGDGLCGEPHACTWRWLAACEAYGRAVLEEVRGATEGERIVSGLFPEEFEEVDLLATLVTLV